MEKEDKSNIEIKIKELETEISVLDQKQYALKILLNAGYGAFANEWFSMYDIRLAKSITYTSQLVIKWMKQYVKEKLNLSAIYNDTDSAYFSIIQPIRKLCIAKNLNYDTLTYEEKSKLFDIISSKIDSTIKEGYDILQDNLNVFEKTLSMKRELYGDKGIWLGKKMYCIKVIDKEGIQKVPTDKPYVKGFDIAKKSATPKWIIDILTEYLELVFEGNKEKIVKFERDKYKEFLNLEPDNFFFIRSVSSFNNYNDVKSKGVQAHIKGALIYNKIVKEQKLKRQFPIIKEGNRIRFCYVLEPNNINSNSLGYHINADGTKFIDIALKEYNLKIDYNRQWDVIFLGPARRLTEAIKMNMNNIDKVSFSKFFSKK